MFFSGLICENHVLSLHCTNKKLLVEHHASLSNHKNNPHVTLGPRSAWKTKNHLKPYIQFGVLFVFLLSC